MLRRRMLDQLLAIRNEAHEREPLSWQHCGLRLALSKPQLLLE